MGAPLLFDLAGRGSIVLTGKDRASFLQGLVTNDVKKLRPGEGCDAAFLTAKGKLLATCVVLAEADRLVLDTPPELAATVEALLRKYLVFAEVTISNETGATSVFHLTAEADGDDAEDFLRRVMGPRDAASMPQGLHAHTAAVFTLKENLPVLLVRENRTGVPGFDLRLPSSHSGEIRNALTLAGAQPSNDEELERRRIHAGIPVWGRELTEAVLPDEAGLRERGFISETKGCYVGQEIVARIKTYGHVNRLLVRLDVSGGVPGKGDRVFSEGEDCGTVTSAAAGLPASGGAEPAPAVALAYVKREQAKPGTALTLSSREENLSSPRSLPARVAPAPLV